MYDEWLCFLVVSMIESRTRKASEPRSGWSIPGLFNLILTSLVPLSLALLSGKYRWVFKQVEDVVPTLDESVP